MNEDQNLNEEFSYDQIAYPGLILPHTHPDSLAAVAKLHGMNPAPAEKCRVLELGCGGGLNLNWLAYGLPESEFVGVDLAKNHIDAADKDKAQLKLQNVSFYQQNVLEITAETLGKFDYIIAHGLFSWVPDFVREKILSLYDELLTPNGVGFISYNVYPGCYRREIVRDIMRFHTQRIDNPVDKVNEGIAFIDFLAEHVNDSSAYQEILKYELKGFSRRPLENIYHDDFSEVNQPFYFTEFIAEAEKHNLKFISESDYLVTERNNKSREIVEVFGKFSRNTIEYEQYSDFLECRRFRQTLLCKKDVGLFEDISPRKVREFYISSLLKPLSPEIDLNPETFKEFVSNKGETVRIGHVLTKLVLSTMVNAGVHPLKFTDLIENAIALLQTQGFVYDDPEKEIDMTASLLMQLYSPHAIKFHNTGSKVLTYVSEKPTVSEFARWQSKRGNSAVNYYGVGLTIEDESTQLLLNLLDGTRTQEDLIAKLAEDVRANEEIADKEEALAAIEGNLDRDLFVLAKMGFLIA